MRNESESGFSDSQWLKSEEIARVFEESIRSLENFDIMEEIVTKFYVNQDAIQSMLGAIILWRRKHNFPWENPKIKEVFTLITRQQYNLFKRQKLNLTQTGLSTLLSLLEDRRQRKGMHPDYLTLGQDAEGCGLVTGDKGAGKSSLVAEEIIGPTLRKPNWLVVHNMNLIDPIDEKMEELTEKYVKAFNKISFSKDSFNEEGIIEDEELLKLKFRRDLDKDLSTALDYISLRGWNRAFIEYEDVGFDRWEIQLEDKNAQRLDNCFYASTIPQALRMIVTHALKGIEETGHPYPSLWIVDEAGISRGKQKAIEKRLLTHKYITLISRKLGCFECSIYQLDDAPKEMEAFATHRFHKPSRKHKDWLDSEIDSSEFKEKAKVRGILDWYQRKKAGLPYIKFGTYDIATMVSEFDLRALLDYTNQISKDGKPVKTKVQLKRILEFIDKSENRISSLLNRDEALIFILRNREHYRFLYKNLKAKGKLNHKEQIMLEKYKMLKSDDTAVLIAQAELPDEKWYTMNLRGEFKRLRWIYPNCLEWDMLPEDNTLKDLAGAVTVKKIEEHTEEPDQEENDIEEDELTVID